MTSATSRASTGDVFAAPNGRRIVSSLAIESAALQGTRNVFRPGEVADDDLGPGRAKCRGAIVLSPNEGPDGQVAPTEDLDDLSAHATEVSRGTRDENRCVNRHGGESFTGGF